jgi:plasmid stabilization system protein ParE
VTTRLRQLHAWIVSQRSEQAANRWLANLMRALSGLQTFPRRHPRAREADQFREVVLRQMVFGRIRLLYVVQAAEVVVLHARHASRHDLGPDETSGWPEHVREPAMATE